MEEGRRNDKVRRREDGKGRIGGQARTGYGYVGKREVKMEERGRSHSM